MPSYFSFFPTTIYKNKAVNNVILKAAFDESVKNNLALFYPYSVVAGERPEQIASHYYNDSSYDWIVYFSNNITDPYHEWYKSEEVMRDYIINKHGSIELCATNTSFYRTNELLDERVISAASYQALSATLKKYWKPELISGSDVLTYSRKEINLISETNQVVELRGTFSGINIGDVIKQSESVRGTVSFASTDTVVIKHVLGTWQEGVSVTKTVTNQAVSATITNVKVLSQSIPLDEYAYWQAVDTLTEEYEINESRKDILLLHNEYVDQVEQQMRELLSL